MVSWDAETEEDEEEDEEEDKEEDVAVGLDLPCSPFLMGIKDGGGGG